MCAADFWNATDVDNLFEVGIRLPASSPTAWTFFLVASACLALLVLCRPSSSSSTNMAGSVIANGSFVTSRSARPPGPTPYPLIGSLHLLAASYPDSAPWTAFGRLRDVYGDVFRIRLGSTDCVVVSSMDSIREVLLQKADHFSGRPNFLRYDVLFGGSRDKSLALCNWSKIQKLRRRIATPYVFPRPETENFEVLEAIIESELDDYIVRLIAKADAEPHATTVFDKRHFSMVAANMFFAYFCSKRYGYDDDYFRQMVDRFDLIFHDINGGFALDFLPWLLPFYWLHLTKLYDHGRFIRGFLMDTLIKEWHTDDEGFDGTRPSCDFLDVVLSRTDPRRIKEKSKRLTNEYALYELEDILGGHTAVSSFWARVLVQVAPFPDVQSKIRDELHSVLEATGDGTVRLSHQQQMPYMRAVIMETLRMTTSPIVPHVAVQETSISGYAIDKDTLVFLNNYHLNTSDLFWTSPREFNPNRFLDAEGRLFKPDHFLPFGIGKRSCMGHQLVQSIMFLATAKLLLHFDVLPSPDTDVPPVEPAKLSVYDESVRVLFRLRRSRK